MANLHQYTEEEAQKALLEATGSWANIWEAPGFEPSPSPELSIATRAHESKSSAEQLKMFLRAYRISAIGFHSFVLPYERYKKEKSRHYKYDASKPFGLDKYSEATSASLKQDFPNTRIHEWSPTSPQKSTWFADKMRNSIAHGQTKTMMYGGRLSVAISNTKDGFSMDSDITMDVNDYIFLVASSLSTFVGNVVAGGRLEPLSTLLDHVAPRFHRVSPRQSALSSTSLAVNPTPQTPSLNTTQNVAKPVSTTAPGSKTAGRTGKGREEQGMEGKKTKKT